jgi:hypothetical protein
MLGEPFQLRQLVDLQPFVQQEIEIAPGRQGGLHLPIFAEDSAEPAGRSRKSPILRSDRSFGR